jgi:hypothetical protein
VRRFLKFCECKHFFKIFFQKQSFFLCVLCVCVCDTFSKNTASSFFCSGLDARERVRLKKTTERRVFHRRRATMAASVLITCYNISERALAKSPKARARVLKCKFYLKLFFGEDICSAYFVLGRRRRRRRRRSDRHRRRVTHDHAVDFVTFVFVLFFRRFVFVRRFP